MFGHAGIIASCSYGVGNELAWTLFHASDLNNAASPDVTTAVATMAPGSPYDDGDYVVIPHTLTSSSFAGWQNGVAWKSTVAESPYTDPNKLSVMAISLSLDNNRHATLGNSFLGFGEYGTSRSLVPVFRPTSTAPRGLAWISNTFIGGSDVELGRFPALDSPESVTCIVQMNGSGSGKDFFSIGFGVDGTSTTYASSDFTSSSTITSTASKIGLSLSNTGSGGANNGSASELAAKIKYCWNEIDLVDDWETLTTSDFVSTTPVRDVFSHMASVPTDGPNGGILFDMDGAGSANALLTYTTIWNLNLPADYNYTGNQIWVHEISFPAGVDTAHKECVLGLAWWPSQYADMSTIASSMFAGVYVLKSGSNYITYAMQKILNGYNTGPSAGNYTLGDKWYLITFVPYRNTPINLWVYVNSSGVIQKTYGQSESSNARYQGKLKYSLFHHFTSTASSPVFNTEVKIRRKLVYWVPDDVLTNIPDCNYTNGLTWTNLTTSHFVNPAVKSGGTDVGALNPGTITDAGSDNLSVAYTTASVTPGDGITEGNYWNLNCFDDPNAYELSVLSISHEFQPNLSTYQTYDVLGIAIGNGTTEHGFGLAFNNGTSTVNASTHIATTGVQPVVLTLVNNIEIGRSAFIVAGSASGSNRASSMLSIVPRYLVTNTSGPPSSTYQTELITTGTTAAKMFLASTAIPAVGKRGFANTIYGKYKFINQTIPLSTGWTEITASDIELISDPDGIAGTPVTSDSNGLGFNMTFAGIRDGILETPAYKINSLPRFRRDGTQVILFRITVNSTAGMGTGGGLVVSNYGYGSPVRGGGISYRSSTDRIKSTVMTSETNSTNTDTYNTAPQAGEHIIVAFYYVPYDGEYVSKQTTYHYDGSNQVVSVQGDSYGSLSALTLRLADNWYLCPVSMIGAMTLSDSTRFKVEYKVFDIYPANEFDGD